MRLKQFFSIFMICVFLTLGVAASATDEQDLGPMVKIGLKYGSSAVAGANLLNDVGSGYSFGYFDESMTFVSLGYTAQKEISMVKTQNLRYDGTNYTASGSGALAGCYHVRLPGSFASFDEALAVAGQYSGGFVAYIRGEYQARVGSYASNDEAVAAQASFGGDAGVVGTSAYGISVLSRGTSTILFQFDTGDETGLAVTPDLGGNTFATTWFSGFRYYGAFRYTRIGGGDLTVANVLPLELYITGVVPSEMGNHWPVEALKAQACCARTYAARYIGSSKHRSSGFDLCPTTCCQAYSGRNQANDRSDQAVLGTAGEYVWYGDRYAETYYFSSSGGATDDVENVWGNKLEWLRGIYDPYETAYASNIPGYSYSATFSTDDLTQLLRNRGNSNSKIVNFYVSEFSSTGNAKKVTFVDSNGQTYTYSGEKARIMLAGVRSIRFNISGGGSYFVNNGETIGSVNGNYVLDGKGQAVPYSGDLPYIITGSGISQLHATDTGDSFIVSGTGYGHNVGMSQFGAKAMAEQGFNYKEILTFYFTDVRVGNE